MYYILASVVLAAGLYWRKPIAAKYACFARRSITECLFVYSRMRSTYRWKARRSVPRLLRRPIDYIFNLNSQLATLDCPADLRESICVTRAMLGRSDMCVDVTQDMNRLLDNMNDIGWVCVHMEDVLPIPFIKEEVLEWSLEVTYIGHANPKKRVPAAQFCVKYAAHPVDGVPFPPYPASENIKKGFGAPRVVSARSFYDEDLVDDAKIYAGLHANFYEDTVEQSILKNYIGTEEAVVLLAEKGRPVRSVVVNRQ